MKSVNEKLLEAAKSGDTEAVKHCLGEAGCDPLSKDKGGRSALMWAAREGYEDCVRILLPVSDPLAKENHGHSALMLAASISHYTCVRLLLPHSDPLAQNRKGRTALMQSAGIGDKHCVMLLLPHSDPLALDKEGRSASQRARHWKYSAVADMIDAHIAQREADILAEHVSSRPKQGQEDRKNKPRL